MADVCGTALLRLLILSLELKSRDFTESHTRAIRPDQKIQARLRDFRAILEWPAEKRVGCFLGALIGVIAGGAFIYYHLD